MQIQCIVQCMVFASLFSVSLLSPLRTLQAHISLITTTTTMSLFFEPSDVIAYVRQNPVIKATHWREGDLIDKSSFERVLDVVESAGHTRAEFFVVGDELRTTVYNTLAGETFQGPPTVGVPHSQWQWMRPICDHFEVSWPSGAGHYPLGTCAPPDYTYTSYYIHMRRRQMRLEHQMKHGHEPDAEVSGLSASGPKHEIESDQPSVEAASVPPQRNNKQASPLTRCEWRLIERAEARLLFAESRIDFEKRVLVRKRARLDCWMARHGGRKARLASGVTDRLLSHLEKEIGRKRKIQARRDNRALEKFRDEHRRHHLEAQADRRKWAGLPKCAPEARERRDGAWKAMGRRMARLQGIIRAHRQEVKAGNLKLSVIFENYIAQDY